MIKQSRDQGSNKLLIFIINYSLQKAVRLIGKRTNASFGFNRKMLRCAGKASKKRDCLLVVMLTFELILLNRLFSGNRGRLRSELALFESATTR